MLVSQVISQTSQRRQTTLDPAANRLQLAKEAEFKPYPARVGDSIDGVKREHDAGRLQQEIRVANTGRGRGDPVDIQLGYGRRDCHVHRERYKQALRTLTTST